MGKRTSLQIATDFLSMLERDPANSREAISSSVFYLMVKDQVKLADLAKCIHVNSSYMDRKINEGRWKFEELDIMAEFFEVHAGDFLRGPKYISEMYEENTSNEKSPQGEVQNEESGVIEENDEAYAAEDDEDEIAEQENDHDLGEEYERPEAS